MSSEPIPAPDGETLKAAGMESVSANAAFDWRNDVLGVVEVVARALPRFSIDDVRDECESQGIGEPHHPNAWGTIMSSAATRKWIVATSDFENSERAPAHARAVRVWRSLIYGGPVIKQHENEAVQALLTAFRGQVIFDPLYMPPVASLQQGYETIKRMFLWACEQNNVNPASVPAKWRSIVEVLAWMRDHWGPEVATAAAVERFGKSKERWTSPLPSIEETADTIWKASRKGSGLPDVSLSEASKEAQAMIRVVATDVLDLVWSRARSAAMTSQASPTLGSAGSNPLAPEAVSIDNFAGGPGPRAPEIVKHTLP